jgi:hypothetical protein
MFFYKTPLNLPSILEFIFFLVWSKVSRNSGHGTQSEEDSVQMISVPISFPYEYLCLSWSSHLPYHVIVKGHRFYVFNRYRGLWYPERNISPWMCLWCLEDGKSDPRWSACHQWVSLWSPQDTYHAKTVCPKLKDDSCIMMSENLTNRDGSRNSEVKPHFLRYSDIRFVMDMWSLSVWENEGDCMSQTSWRKIYRDQRLNTIERLWWEQECW